MKKHVNNTYGLSLGHPLLTQSLGQLSAVKGECLSNDSSCYTSFYIFTGVVLFMSFFIASGRIGTLLLQLRAIEVEDKVPFSHFHFTVRLILTTSAAAGRVKLFPSKCHRSYFMAFTVFLFILNRLWQWP